MRAIGDGPYNFKPQSRDESDTRSGTLLSKLPHQANGRTMSSRDLTCIRPLNMANLQWLVKINSDESTFEILQNKAQFVRRRREEKFHSDCVVQTVKHSTKIMIWSVISGKGTGHLYVVKCMMRQDQTATAGSDVVQSRRRIFDDFFQHFWPYIGNYTANVVFQMVKHLWLIRIDQ
ncbi:uncharacterized protein TNCV_702901 [Trichonephila clavipes]|nr:uncharacterized protein TNCV_702901 [Trichonephila clavipes]